MLRRIAQRPDSPSVARAAVQDPWDGCLTCVAPVGRRCNDAWPLVNASVRLPSQAFDTTIGSPKDQIRCQIRC